MRFLALVALFTVMPASVCFAQNGNVPQSTLNAFGLHGLQAMSDNEGMQVRGQFSVSGISISTVTISYRLESPDGAPIVAFSDSDMDMSTTSGVPAVASLSGMNMNMDVSVVPPVFTYSASVTFSITAMGSFTGIP